MLRKETEMRKVFISCIIAIVCMIAILPSFSKVSAAENEKAQLYRQIFSSGSFYVEYEDNHSKKILAENAGRRMSRTTLSGQYAAMLSVLNPLAALFQSGSTKYPDFMHANGKYFKFFEKDHATMIEDDRLDEENLNPTEGWNSIEKTLSLPDELAVFYWEDPFHKESKSISKPVFSTTMRKAEGGKEYDCDIYISKIMSASGSTETVMAFYMFYDNDVLSVVKSSVMINGKEYDLNKLHIKKILPEMPKNEFQVYDKAKVYAAGIGDMNDLLESPVFVGLLKDL